ncbi:MAG: sigma-70 family RNA polymerase sigma factor [Candidatus Limiplasma sp.]|nr:sigma-70 family RNA polymerase sigma factor [Candidatus Limiplasma sp.]
MEAPEMVFAVNAQEHLGLAHLCAKRFFRHGLEYGELLREATLSLVAAAARFDPRKGVCFSTYAVPCILHDLRRACEKGDPMHVPRTQRELLRQAFLLRGEFLRRTGQEPSLEELAGGMGLPPEELGAAIAAHRRMETLREAGWEDPHERTASLPDRKAERFVDYLLLLDVIARLPRPIPRLIHLRFIRSHTQADTARMLRISQAQVSKLEQRAKEALREALARE